MQRHGRLDILVNNAGINRRNSLAGPKSRLPSTTAAAIGTPGFPEGRAWRQPRPPRILTSFAVPSWGALGMQRSAPLGANRPPLGASRQPLESLSTVAFQRVLDCNLIGPAVLAQAPHPTQS